MSKKSPRFALQYLEPSTETATLDPAVVRRKLHDAFACLPIQYLILGWDLPQQLVDACADEAQRAKAQLYRWQPLLTDDGALQPQPAWQTIGLQGEHVPGFQNMAEFTFLCPNRPVVRDAILAHLQQLGGQGVYQGFFLDRIRYPSPATNPIHWLACTCPDCQAVAGTEGLDLTDLSQRITRLLSETASIPSVLNCLFRADAPTDDHPDLIALTTFLDFRSRSITRFVQAAADLLHANGIAVGLDTFSPVLTRLVGQDIAALAPCADWVKPMSYCHTLGPAGLPFELLGLCDWLVAHHGLAESWAYRLLGEASRLPLPSSRSALRTQGLASSALVTEMARARNAGVKTLLAGVELVEIAGVAELTESQLSADHQALRTSDVDGLVLSWDLWHIPLARLQQVARIWVGKSLIL